MLFGELSNKLAPAIVVSADLLGDIQSKYFGLKREFSLYPYTRHHMTHWFNQLGLSIYVVCMFEYTDLAEKIEKVLDDFFVPYSRLYEIEYAEDLWKIVSADHVIGFFYGDKELVNERMSKEKFLKVPHLTEVEYILGGGTR